MAVDKILELDLSNLTAEGLALIDEQLGSIEDELKKAGKKPKAQQKKKGLLSKFEKQDEKTEKRLAKLQKQLEFDSISGKQSKNLKDRLFQGTNLSNILKLGQNPTSFFSSTLLKMIPVLGTILAVTGVFVALAKKVDDFQKKFVDSVDDRIDLFRSKQQQALIQAGLAQEIFTTSAGGTEPRDAYNTFEQFNNNQAAIERDFALRNTSGVD